MFVSQNLIILLLEGSLDINQVPLLHFTQMTLENISGTMKYIIQVTLNCVKPILELAMEQVLESRSHLLLAHIFLPWSISCDKWLIHFSILCSWRICSPIPFLLSPQDPLRIQFLDQASLSSFLEVKLLWDPPLVLYKSIYKQVYVLGHKAWGLKLHVQILNTN